MKPFSLAGFPGTHTLVLIFIMPLSNAVTLPLCNLENEMKLSTGFHSNLIILSSSVPCRNTSLLMKFNSLESLYRLSLPSFAAVVCVVLRQIWKKIPFLVCPY